MKTNVQPLRNGGGTVVTAENRHLPLNFSNRQVVNFTVSTRAGHSTNFRTGFGFSLRIRQKNWINPRILDSQIFCGSRNLQYELRIPDSDFCSYIIGLIRFRIHIRIASPSIHKPSHHLQKEFSVLMNYYIRTTRKKRLFRIII